MGIFREPAVKKKKRTLKDIYKHQKIVLEIKKAEAPGLAREISVQKTKQWDDRLDEWKENHKILGKLLLFWHSSPR